MLGFRRVSFQIAFMGLGLRMRASLERWWERSTGVAMFTDDEDDAIGMEEAQRSDRGGGG